MNGRLYRLVWRTTFNKETFGLREPEEHEFLGDREAVGRLASAVLHEVPAAHTYEAYRRRASRGEESGAFQVGESDYHPPEMTVKVYSMSGAEVDLGRGMIAFCEADHTDTRLSSAKTKTQDGSVRSIMDELDALKRTLYALPSGASGGPLHVIVDDGNIKGADLDSAWKDVERESSATMRRVCGEILQKIALLTEPQRLVWWLRERIRALGIDAVKLAEDVREGVVDYQTGGLCDARIKLGDKFAWIGLEQLETLASRSKEGKS